LTTHNVRESRAGKATPESFFARVVAEFGASRIAWGSNFPASEGSLPGLLAEARSALAALPNRDRDWIFFRTAQSLYPALAGHEEKSRAGPAAMPGTKSIIRESGSSNPTKKEGR
jgi:hypothetical protein